MKILRQSTSIDLPIGPFLDSTDGITPETALSITQPDVRLKKVGGAWAQKAAAQTLSHEENGFYEVTYDGTDTNTLGLLKVAILKAGALPVWDDFMVVPANVHASLISGSQFLSVDLAQWLGVQPLGVIFGGAISTFANVTHTATAQGGSTSTITLASSASTSDNKYKGAMVHIVGGTAPERARRIVKYVGSTRVATVYPLWDIAPDATSVYVVYGDGGIGDTHLMDGQAFEAQGGASGSITLNAFSSGVNDSYKNSIIYILAGAGSKQARRISSYNGTTKVADVHPNWDSDPDATSVYVIYPFGRVDLASWRGQTPDDLVNNLVPVDVKRWKAAVPTDLQSGNVPSWLYGTITGAIQDTAFSAETALKTIRWATAQAGAASTITLDTGASGTDDMYKGLRILITGGSGIYQSRLIIGYVGSTKIATVDRPWLNLPDSTSVFVITYAEAVDVGAWRGATPLNLANSLVQSFSSISSSDFPVGSVVSDGANTEATFKTNLTQATDDYWTDALLVITSGDLVNQVKKVLVYDGTDKFITVEGGFTGIPAAAVTFVLVNR